jgi:hypothetical protein
MPAGRQGAGPREVSVLKGPTVARSVFTLMLVAGLGLAPAARATCTTAAAAVQTSTRAHLPSLAQHRRHHAHRRGGAGAQTALRASSTPTAPARPAHRAERRAALPSQVRTHRHSPGSRQGLAMLMPSGTEVTSIAAQRLDDPSSRPVPCHEGRVISGRGPPRAPPLARLSPASSPGPDPSRRSPASAHPTAPAPSAPHPPFVAAPWPRFGASLTPVVHSPEPVLGRSHVRRPEGATTCISMPSSGDVL